MDIISKALNHTSRTAVVCSKRTFTYSDLLQHSSYISHSLLSGKSDLNSETVAFLTPQTYEYLPCQWGIWRAGGIAVPLCKTHPPAEWEYMITNCNATTILCHDSYASHIQPIADKHNKRLITIGNFSKEEFKGKDISLNIDGSRPAMIIYTSGTTGKPKGVVTTHDNIKAQVESLVQAWEWSEKDHILETLPLHHVHGVVNVLGCAMYSGAKVTFHPGFDTNQVWKEIANNNLTLYMAVPTIYHKLLQELKDSANPAAYKEACKKLRLMVSGSMALPEPLFYSWEEFTGHRLLERYGMTEIGMALSNPLHGNRRPGFVGFPLPNVQARIVDDELRIKGPAVFKDYYGNEKATKETFDEEGWFKTGDNAMMDPKTGEYKILGRSSVDIIKTGGFKVSALDIERTFLENDRILEIAVCGVSDEQWGQVIGAIIKFRGQPMSLHELQDWGKEKLAHYKLPRKLITVDEIPRNAMGKVNKKELVRLFN
jgi:malonyl-CoA/methylmalonyl-CoA synthetase